MFDFITVPLIVGIICASIYGLFELFIRRKERLAIIEKMGDKLDTSFFKGKLGLPNYMARFSFSSLKIGCLLTGIGLGMLVGFIINSSLSYSASFSNRGWYHGDMGDTAYGASVLLFGGLGLILAFIVEMKLAKKKEN